MVDIKPQVDPQFERTLLVLGQCVKLNRKVNEQNSKGKRFQHDSRPRTSASNRHVQEYAILSIEDSWYRPMTDSIQYAVNL